MATGSLRAQLAYPAAATSATPDDDDALCAALGAVDLGHLAVELDATDDWTSRLSLGEQQRLSVARALLKRPVLVFLDESTSSMDVHTERKLYKLLKDNVPLLVSVAHRPTVTEHHTHVLECVRYDRAHAPGDLDSRTWAFRALAAADYSDAAALDSFADQ